MPALNRRLDLLRRLPRSLREAALLATLPHADAHERDAVVAEVLALADRPGEAPVPSRLLRAWTLLSAEARGAVVAAVGGRLPALLADLGRSSDDADRAAGAHLAIAALLLGPTDPQGASAALDAGAARFIPEIDEALAEAAARFDEQRLDALMDAVARVAHAPGPRLRAWLADTEQPGHMALRAAARALPVDLSRRRAVAWLGVPALRGVARDFLQRVSSIEDRAPFLARGHLLRAPSRATALRSSGEAGARLLATAPDTDPMHSIHARSVVRWALALPMKPDRRTALLAGGFTAPCALARFDAASALASAPPGPATDAALVDFAFDDSEPVARLAASVLADAPSPSRRASTEAPLRRLARSPHAGVRTVAQEALEDRDPLNDRHLADPLACPLGARRALGAEPLEFLIALRRAYAEAASERRVRLFALAQRLSVLDRLEAELVEAVGSPDERLASKAALLLGRVRVGERARDAIASALEAPSDRVRANAVEALLRAAPADARVEAWSADESPRVRANALRHRLLVRREPTGERLLAEMLGDPRPGHRLSALWVAERARSASVVNRVADLTRHDDDPRVHARARRCARALLASMRHGWAAPSGAAR